MDEKTARPLLTGSDPSPREITGTGGDALPIRLSSGHELSVHPESHGDRVEIRTPSGRLDVSIHLTENGPVVRVHGGALEMDAVGALGIRCEELAIEARRSMKVETGEEIQLRTEGDVRVRSAGDTYIDGDYVNLNCLDRTGYHDATPPTTEENSNNASGE
ncbi:MAG: hypothetical protein R3E97_11025 [Candidatus Eisenbacteria bacterium]